MRVAPHFPVPAAAHQQSEFAVRFQPHQAVVHLHAGLLQIFCPANVGRFIEPGLQLHHHGHFFFGRRLHQRADNRRILARAVQSLFDGEHIWIVDRALDELHDGGVRIVRVMQQHVVFPQKVKHVAETRF
jgi:hypothetical protein